MKALQYRRIGGRPELVDLATPEPGPGEIRLRITAAGACHSDEFIMSAPSDQYSYPLPLTLGHEAAGAVDKLGAGVTGVEIGEPVLVYGPWGCGRCYPCSQGKENDCDHGIKAPGIFTAGAMAEYMIVDDARHLVPLGDLDPVQSVSLTDAGLTPYHAVMLCMAKLKPGATAVVIGAGGLGHVGIQILRALTAATVIALDIREESRDLARAVGADHAFPSDPEAVQRVRHLTDGRGAHVVFDFVGIQPTADLARAMVRVDGEIAVVGVAEGSVPAGYLTLPFDAAVRVVNWGTRPELIEVMALARTGAIRIEVEKFSLARATTAYDALHAGRIRGRAVVVPP